MVYNLGNKDSAVQKVINVIFSCKNEKHLEVAYNLINNFDDCYKDSDVLDVFLSSIQRVELNNFYKD